MIGTHRHRFELWIDRTFDIDDSLLVFKIFMDMIQYLGLGERANDDLDIIHSF